MKKSYFTVKNIEKIRYELKISFNLRNSGETIGGLMSIDLIDEEK